MHSIAKICNHFLTSISDMEQWAKVEDRGENRQAMSQISEKTCFFNFRSFALCFQIGGGEVENSLIPLQSKSFLMDLQQFDRNQEIGDHNQEIVRFLTLQNVLHTPKSVIIYLLQNANLSRQRLHASASGIAPRRLRNRFA